VFVDCWLNSVVAADATGAKGSKAEVLAAYKGGRLGLLEGAFFFKGGFGMRGCYFRDCEKCWSCAR
jgi:hypothetical protein